MCPEDMDAIANVDEQRTKTLEGMVQKVPLSNLKKTLWCPRSCVVLELYQLLIFTSFLIMVLITMWLSVIKSGQSIKLGEQMPLVQKDL